MPSKIYSGAIVGLDAKLVEIETEVSHGLRSFSIVGLADKAIKEAEERVDAAIKSSKLLSPHARTFKVLVNLAPADLKKEGSLYDLPLALGFLLASKQTTFDAQGKLFLGELSLNGQLRPIKGALSFALLAKDQGLKEIILPLQNATEASLVEGIKIVGVTSLSEVIAYLENRTAINQPEYTKNNKSDSRAQIDLSWIKGQEYAKRALEITAAGGHNLFMFGPPGGGKSLLAKALPSILPKLNFSEALEVTKIYSVAGLLEENHTLLEARPFRAPHHASSDVALVGGGTPPRIGEITLAHRGVLFLDEFPEFHRDVLESLRQPIEDGSITITRAKYNVSYPARFMLVAASNPCPCGYLADPDRSCTCSSSQVAMYRRKLSGPLMDRMDLCIEVPAVKYEKLTSEASQIQSAVVRKKIEVAREKQKERFKNTQIFTNAEMHIPEIKTYCGHDQKSQDLLKKYVDSGKLSARGYHRVLKVARTIADLENKSAIEYPHVAEALMYRVKE